MTEKEKNLLPVKQITRAAALESPLWPKWGKILMAHRTERNKAAISGRCSQDTTRRLPSEARGRRSLLSWEPSDTRRFEGPSQSGGSWKSLQAQINAGRAERAIGLELREGGEAVSSSGAAGRSPNAAFVSGVGMLSRPLMSPTAPPPPSLAVSFLLSVHLPQNACRSCLEAGLKRRAGIGATFR